MEERIAPHHIAESLVGGDHSGELCSLHCLLMELADKTEGETTRRAEVEAFPAERTVIFAAAFRARTTDSRHPSR